MLETKMDGLNWTKLAHFGLGKQFQPPGVQDNAFL